MSDEGTAMLDAQIDWEAIRRAKNFFAKGPAGESLHQLGRRVAGGRLMTIERVGDQHWGALTGILLMDDALIRILVRETDPTSYRTRCILHEFGHVLCGHKRCTALTAVPSPADDGSLLDVLRGNAADKSARAYLCTRPTHEIVGERTAEEIARLGEAHLLKPQFNLDERSWAVA